MSEKTYGITEIFYSIQGEGINAGRPAVFVRFAGCNLDCNLNATLTSPGGWTCDTDFRLRQRLTGNQIVERCLYVMSATTRLVIFTGGEPALQLDAELVGKFCKVRGLELAIETNGMVKLDYALNWICVSPKVFPLALTRADEVKYVIKAGDPLPDINAVQACYYLLSPAFDGQRMVKANVDHCVKLAKEHPPWRVSLQIHKFLEVR